MDDNNMYDLAEIIVDSEQPTSSEDEVNEEYQPETPNFSDENSEKNAFTEIIEKSKLCQLNHKEYELISPMTPPTPDCNIKTKIQCVSDELPFNVVQALLSLTLGFPKAKFIVENWVEEHMDELDNKTTCDEDSFAFTISEESEEEEEALILPEEDELSIQSEEYDSLPSEKEDSFILTPRKEYLTTNRRPVMYYIKEYYKTHNLEFNDFI